MSNRKQTRRAIHVSEDAYVKIAAAADAADIPMSQVLTRMIERYAPTGEAKPRTKG